MTCGKQKYRSFGLPNYFLILIGGMLLHQIASYYGIYTTFRSGATSIELRAFALFPSLIIGMFLWLHYRLFSTSHRASPKLFLLWIACTLSGIAIGAIAAIEKRYLVTDTFRYLCPWLYFWFSVGHLSFYKTSSEGIALRLLDVIALLAFIDAIATIYLFLIYQSAKISTYLHMFGIGWALFRFENTKTRYRVLLFVICVIALIACGKRGNLLVVPMAALGAFIWNSKTSGQKFAQNIRKLSIALFVAFLIGHFALEIFNQSSRVDLLKERYINTSLSLQDAAQSYGSSDISWQARMDEGKLVLDYMTENPQFLLLGAGFGATTPSLGNKNVVPSRIPGRMHHVHIGWFVYLLRNGLLGIVLYLGFFLAVLFRVTNRQASKFNGLVLYWLIIMALLSFKSNVLLELVDLSLVASAAWALPQRT